MKSPEMMGSIIGRNRVRAKGVKNNTYCWERIGSKQVQLNTMHN